MRRVRGHLDRPALKRAKPLRPVLAAKVSRGTKEMMQPCLIDLHLISLVARLGGGPAAAPGPAEVSRGTKEMMQPTGKSFPRGHAARRKAHAASSAVSESRAIKRPIRILMAILLLYYFSGNPVSERQRKEAASTVETQRKADKDKAVAL